MSEAKNEVDFALKSDIEGNLFRISNNNTNDYSDHLLISNVINALKIYPGKNRLYPTFGFADYLLRIGASFKTKDEASAEVYMLQSALQEHYGFDIEVKAEYSSNEDEVTLTIDLGNLPGKIVSSVKGGRTNSTTIKSEYIQ